MADTMVKEINLDIETIQETSKIRKLIERLPFISGCVQPERVSKMFTLAYDFEIENGDKEENTFKCTKNDIDYPGIRLFILHPIHYNASDTQAALTGMARLILAEFSSYYKKGIITNEQMQNVIIRYDKDAKVSIPEIDSILTYEQAIAAGFWWF